MPCERLSGVGPPELITGIAVPGVDIPEGCLVDARVSPLALKRPRLIIRPLAYCNQRQMLCIEHSGVSAVGGVCCLRVGLAKQLLVVSEIGIHVSIKRFYPVTADTQGVREAIPDCACG